MTQLGRRRRPGRDQTVLNGEAASDGGLGITGCGWHSGRVLVESLLSPMKCEHTDQQQSHGNAGGSDDAHGIEHG